MATKCNFLYFFVGVPNLSIYIFLNFKIKTGLGAGVDLARLLPHLHQVYWMTQDLSTQPLDRELCLLSTRPD